MKTIRRQYDVLGQSQEPKDHTTSEIFNLNKGTFSDYTTNQAKNSVLFYKDKESIVNVERDNERLFNLIPKVRAENNLTSITKIHDVDQFFSFLNESLYKVVSKVHNFLDVHFLKALDDLSIDQFKGSDVDNIYYVNHPSDFVQEYSIQYYEVFDKVWVDNSYYESQWVESGYERENLIVDGHNGSVWVESGYYDQIEVVEGYTEQVLVEQGHFETQKIYKDQVGVIYVDDHSPTSDYYKYLTQYYDAKTKVWQAGYELTLAESKNVWVDTSYYESQWVETNHYQKTIWVDTSHYEDQWVDTKTKE